MSLRQQAYGALRARIVGLDLPPGSRIVERDTAAELGVSRVPLREALQLLEAEGLVVVVPRRGAMVAPFTPADVRELFEVRSSVEVLAARLAATRRTEAHLVELARLVEAARDAVAAEDDAAAAAANARFHVVVVQASGNRLLESVVRPLEARVEWLFNLTRHRDLGEQGREHAAVLAALAEGDGERAAALHGAHVAAGLAPTLAAADGWASADLDPAEVTRSRRRSG